MLGSKSEGDLAQRLLSALEASVTVPARLRQGNGGGIANYNTLHNDTRDQALTSMYNQVFGHGPTAAQLSAWDGSVMDFYAAYAGSEDGAKGAMFGVFQSVADQGTYAIGGAGNTGVHGSLYQGAKVALDNAAHGIGVYAALT